MSAPCGSPIPTGCTSRPAVRRSSTSSTTTARWARGSCGRCTSDRACCTASPRGLTRRRSTRSGSPPGRRRGLQTVRLHFPRYGRYADELCVTELASVIWAVQMSTVEFHPWNSRRADTEKPDEWRIDLDPGDACPLSTVRRVAHVAREVLGELGAVGWPKTSGGSGIHIYVRVVPEYGFGDVRRAALAFAREIERRAPATRPPCGGARTATRPRCSSTTTRTPATTRSPRPTP